MNNDVISLANSLVNNLLRGNQPPSLLDLPQRGAGGYGNQMNFGRFDDRKVSAYIPKCHFYRISIFSKPT